LSSEPEKYPNSGIAFKNNRPTSNLSPHFKGEIHMESECPACKLKFNTDYLINVWIKTSKSNSQFVTFRAVVKIPGYKKE